MRRLMNYLRKAKPEKGTEKYLRQVLISSICSIVLCLSCLTGTTYAWFKTTVVSTVNEISVGEAKMVVSVTKGDRSARSALEPGENYSYEIDEVGTFNFFIINTGNLPGHCIIRITNNLGEAEEFSSGTLYPTGNEEGKPDSVSITLTISGEDIRNEITPLTLEVFPQWGQDPAAEEMDMETQIFETEATESDDEADVDETEASDDAEEDETTSDDASEPDVEETEETTESTEPDEDESEDNNSDPDESTEPATEPDESVEPGESQDPGTDTEESEDSDGDLTQTKDPAQENDTTVPAGDSNQDENNSDSENA